MSDPLSFGATVRHLRQRAGLSVHALARLAGMTEDGLRKLEQSARQPRLDTARRLADALGVSLDKLAPPSSI